MNERVTAWLCIGCGRIEGTQPCIGICQDRKTDFVFASEHDKVLAELTRARATHEILAAIVRQIAHTTPREGECERNYAALQERARRALDEMAEVPHSAPA